MARRTDDIELESNGEWVNRTALLSTDEAQVLVGRVSSIDHELKSVDLPLRLAILDHLLEDQVSAWRAMKYRTMDAMEKQDYSYGDMGKILGITRQAAHEALRLWRNS